MLRVNLWALDIISNPNIRWQYSSTDAAVTIKIVTIKMISFFKHSSSSLVLLLCLRFFG